MNVGDLKMLELPLEWFMRLGYDFEATTRLGSEGFLTHWASREFQLDEEKAGIVADIMSRYSVSREPESRAPFADCPQMYASRRKAELVDSETFSLVNYNE